MPHPSRRRYVQRMKEQAAKELREKREKRAEDINWKD